MIIFSLSGFAMLKSLHVSQKDQTMLIYVSINLLHNNKARSLG